MLIVLLTNQKDYGQMKKTVFICLPCVVPMLCIGTKKGVNQCLKFSVRLWRVNGEKHPRYRW
jgi:hypothetical protein